jgi:hypothetical protein
MLANGGSDEGERMSKHQYFKFNTAAKTTQPAGVNAMSE